MSEIHGLGGKGPQPELQPEKESAKAKVLSSTGRGLTERVPSRFEKIPLIGKLIGWFSQKGEIERNRQEIIDQLSEEYPKQAPWFRQSLEPILRGKDKFELKAFYNFIESKNGAPYLLMIQKNYATASIQAGKVALEKGVNAVISLMKTDSLLVKDRIQYLLTYSGLITRNNTPQETFNFYDTVLTQASQKNEPAAFLKGLVTQLDSLAKTGVSKSKPTDPAIKTVFDNIANKQKPTVQDSDILNQISDTSLKDQMRSLLPDNPQDRLKLYNFFKNGGTVYFQAFLKAHPDGNLSAEVSRLLQSLHLEPELAGRILTVVPRLQTILSSRFTPEVTYNFFTEMLYDPNRAGFHEGIQTIASYERLADEFDKSQTARPQVFIKNDKAGMPTASAISNLPMTSKFLKGLATEISEQIYADNTQVVYQAIAAAWKQNARGDYRTNENAIQRNEFENSLEQEIHQDKPLTVNPNQIDFSYTVKVALRNPQTGETRTLLKKVPIEGNMSETQALLRMQLLNATCARGFDSFYLFEPGNAPNIRQDTASLDGDDLKYSKAILDDEKLALKQWVQNNNVQEKFEKWWDEAQHDFAKVMLDFSGNPPFSFLKDSTSVKDALQDPSPKNAIRAASQQNISDWGTRGDGSPLLALLPKELSQFASIATLSYNELNDLRQAFLSGTPAHIKVPGGTGDAEGKTATVTFSQKEIDVEGTPNAVLMTTITLDNKTITRATQYEIPTGEIDESTVSEVDNAGELVAPQKKTAQSTLEDVVNSREFQSAVLLAKSEFMRTQV